MSKLFKSVYTSFNQGRGTFGIRLTTIHNLHFLLKLMEDIRQAIREDRL